MSADGFSCPLPDNGYDTIVLAHGGGGRLMHELIETVFRSAFEGLDRSPAHDGVTFEARGLLALTTDAFTVSPIEFPGGDIGTLAVCGTVNDLAMCGAAPTRLTAAFVLEEGLPLKTLRRIANSMARTAKACNARIVSGDTKVVEHGKGDGIYIAMTGVGTVVAPQPVNPSRVRPGDAVLVSGPVGDHGIAVMSVREGIAFDTELLSDVAPLVEPVRALIDAGVDIHCLRDATRGGFATVCAEIASAAGAAVRLRESAIPVRPQVRDACELLGLDPLYVASEGCFVAFVRPLDAQRSVQILQAAGHAQASICGEVVPTSRYEAVLVTRNGSERVLDVLSGEQLPRIC